MCGEYQGPLEEYRRLGVEQLWLPTVVRATRTLYQIEFVCPWNINLELYVGMIRTRKITYTASVWPWRVWHFGDACVLVGRKGVVYFCLFLVAGRRDGAVGTGACVVGHAGGRSSY